MLTLDILTAVIIIQVMQQRDAAATLRTESNADAPAGLAPSAQIDGMASWRGYLQEATGELIAEIPPPSSVRGFVAVCRDCDGWGVVHDLCSRHSSGGCDCAVDEDIQCARCEGTGEVKEEE